MITLHTAIYALNPEIKIIRGEDAFDANEQPVQYDKAAAQAKLVELQAAETQAQEAAVAAKQSAMDKLAKLGLTQAEVAALLG
jgi:hypothetical protein